MAEKRVNYSSGAPLEEKVGYSRMVKVGDRPYICWWNNVGTAGWYSVWRKCL